MHATLAKSHFWKWFKRNNALFFDLHKKSRMEMQYLYNEAQAHLHAYCKRLHCEIQAGASQGVLVISARGNSRYFQKADSLVIKAPCIPGWEVISLSPPRPIDFMTREDFGDTGIDPDILWFMPANSCFQNQPDIVVYGEFDNPALHLLYQNVIERMVFNILGERSYALNIGRILIKDVSNIPDFGYPVPLHELPSYVASGNGFYEVNAKGELQTRQ